MTPERAGTESAQINSAQPMSFRIEVSPDVVNVEGDGRAQAVTVYPTAQVDPDLVRFHSLAERRDFDSLTSLCRERLLSAASPETSLRWNKDFSIVKSLQGRYGEALDILASAAWLAEHVGGDPCGRYHSEMGLVLIEFNRSSHALDHFDRSHDCHLKAGNLKGMCVVDNNKAIALDALGKTQEAETCARSAVQLAASIGPEVLRECYETWERLDAKLRGVK